MQWENRSGGQAVARLTLPEPPTRYAWSQARQGVADSSPVEALAPWFDLREGNPLLEWTHVQMITTGSMNVPKITTGEVSKNGNVPDVPAAPVGVSVDGANSQTQVYDLTSQTPLATARWMVGLRARVLEDHVMRHGFAQGQDSWGAVKTGLAAKLSTAQELPARLAAMVAGVPSYYRMRACWMVNEQVEGVLFSQAGYAFPIVDGLPRLLSYPWMPNSHTDAGDTAGDVSAAFGSFYQALVIGMEHEISFREFDQTNPGSLTFFSHSGCAHEATDVRGLSYLQTAA